MGIPEKKAGIPLSFDWPLGAAALILSLIGIVNLASAGSTGVYWHRQLFSMVIGILVMALVSMVDYRQFLRYAYPFYFATLALLLVALTFGHRVAGSRAWLRLGPMSMEPSEFLKIGAILAMAKFFHDQRIGGPYGIKELGIPMLIAALSMGLIMLQPDMGTATMLFLVLSSMILFAGVKRYLIIGSTVFGLLASPIVWKLMRPHQKNRIWAFINPESDAMGIGYNVIQSMYTVGSGRIFGKGYKLGTQTALRYLPERATDFAFSVFAEEWGFVGCMIVLTIFLFIIIWALRIAADSRDRFGCLAGVGIAALIFWHLSVNVAMTCGAFPVVGIPLPFISYGGTFLVTIFAGMGLLMSIEGRRFMF